MNSTLSSSQDDIGQREVLNRDSMGLSQGVGGQQPLSFNNIVDFLKEH